jgi:hypothetical protein
MLAACSGCRSRSSALEDAGIVLRPPAAWTAAPPASFQVPGTPLAAWRGPEGSALVLFRTLPDPDGDAESALAELTSRLQNLPGYRVVVGRVAEVGGRKAARVEVVAPGTGDAIAPTGTGVPVAPPGKALVPTHWTALVLPGRRGTIRLACYYPESARATLAPIVDEAIAGLNVRED